MQVLTLVRIAQAWLFDREADLFDCDEDTVLTPSDHR